MKNKKSKKSGVIIGLLLLILVLLGIWYFLGMPGLDKIKQNDSVAAAKVELEQAVEKTSEGIHKAIEEASIPEKLSEAQEKLSDLPEKLSDLPEKLSDLPEKLQKLSDAAEKTEYSSADCDLNHPENSPLFFGNPSDCIENVEEDTNYLLEKTQFTISYNNEVLCPNWVGWHLTVSDLGEADRSNKFAPDKSLPEGWHEVTKADYQFNAYGFDRGHICPSADRTATQIDNETTFLMTNMVPQAPDCNRVVWMHLETYERELAKEGNELYIFAGPYGTGGVGQKGEFDEIPVTTKDGQSFKINVPEYTWKIILILDQGEEDFSRVTEDTSILSVCVPNKQGCQANGDWQQYLCSVDYIEDLTGFDFFEMLPDTLENVLEAKIWESY